MKIELTKKEYRLLLDYIFLGDWVINAHRTEKRNDIEDYEMLVQKLYSFAKDMDCEEFVQADRERNEYYTTRHYDETARVFEFIEEYDNDSFWDALISRLAERDVYERADEIERKSMGAEEYWRRSEPIEESYYQEFRRNGIDHLRVADDGES